MRKQEAGILEDNTMRVIRVNHSKNVLNTRQVNNLIICNRIRSKILRITYLFKCNTFSKQWGWNILRAENFSKQYGCSWLKGVSKWPFAVNLSVFGKYCLVDNLATLHSDVQVSPKPSDPLCLSELCAYVCLRSLRKDLDPLSSPQKRKKHELTKSSGLISVLLTISEHNCHWTVGYMISLKREWNHMEAQALRQIAIQSTVDGN